MAYGYGMTETRIKNEIKRDTIWAIVFGAIALVTLTLAVTFLVLHTAGTNPLPLFIAAGVATAKTIFTVLDIRDNKEVLHY